MAVLQHPITLKCWRYFKLLTRIIVYVPLGLLILTALLLGTPFGARVTVGVANSVVPNLSVEYQSGSLNGRLALEKAQWSMAGLSVNLNQLVVDWQPHCLLQKQLCVKALVAAKVDLDIDTKKLAQSSEPTLEDDTAATELVLPFAITLTEANLHAISVSVDDMRFNADEIAASAHWPQSGLIVHQLVSKGLEVIIPTSSASNPNANASVTTAVNATNNTRDKTIGTNSSPVNADPSAASERPLASMPEISMPFPITIEHLELSDSRTEIAGRSDSYNLIKLVGNFRQTELALSQLDIIHSYGTLALTGTLNFTQHYPLALKLDSALSQVAEIPELTDARIAMTLDGDLSLLKANLQLAGDLSADIQGDINLQNPQLPYHLQLSNGQFLWPLHEPLYVGKNVALSSQGSLDSQNASLSATINTPYHPPLSVESELSHHDQKLTLAALDLEGALGKLQLTGELSYASSLDWQAKVKVDELNLQSLSLGDNLQLPSSSISGDFNTQGSLTLGDSNADATWSVALNQSLLAGKIDTYPFNISGDVSIDSKMYINAKQLHANALGSTVYLDGTADKQWNLTGRVDVPDVGLWLKEARGQINANLHVDGSEKHPKVSLNATTTGLAISTIDVNTVSISGEYFPLDQHEFELDINASNAQLASQKLEQLNVNTRGNILTQSISLTSKGDVAVTSQIDSEYNEKTQKVNASVNQLSLDSVIGLWQLDDPISLRWDQLNSKGSATAFCLRHTTSTLCVKESLFGQKGTVAVNFDGNIGKLLKPVLPSDFDWDGMMQLLANVNWDAKSKPTANAAITLSPGSFSLNRSKTKRINLDYENLQLLADLNGQRLATSLSFEAVDVARWQSELTVNVTPDRALSGSANIQNVNLQPLGEFFPQLETLQGMLSSDLTFSGTLDTPNVAGKIQMQEGALAASANPTRLEQIQLTLNLSGQQGTLSGGWRMGSGAASLDGAIAWPAGEFSGQMNIKGDKLAVIQPPLAILDVSPDLQIQFDKARLDVKGSVSVPSGNIKIVQLAEGGIAVSDDVVFNDSIAEAQAKTSPYAVTADLNINVGKALMIDGMGLKGMLEGTLSLKQKAFKPPLLYGDINVVNGSYKFMGQTLQIRRGAVQFIGPAEVPNLNIEAIREIKDEDITAGVKVTGTPLRPVVTLFSNPNKEQAEILSYIIKGTGFNSSNGDNNALMMGAAVGLSSQIGGGAISSLGSTTANIIEKFGFSNVQLDTNDEGRVAISGFIGEDLMVKYGVGVFNPGYEMTVRYYLLSQLYLETVSGTLGQSLDIYYNFDL